MTQSKVKILIPEGIFVQRHISEVKWFLNYADDVRSPNHLEVNTTEFHTQVLEIDCSFVA